MGGFIEPSATVSGTESAPGIPNLGAPTGGIYQSVLNGLGYAINADTYVGVDTEKITLGESLLSPVAVDGSPFAGVTEPANSAVDPSGKFLYVANFSSNNVSAYSINATTGVLTPVAGSPFAAGVRPNAIAVDPSGKFVYVANSGNSTVSAYSYNAATGVLTPVAGSPFAAGVIPYAITVDPSGKFLYVGNLGGAFPGTISAYTYNAATGVLTPIAGSPFASTTGGLFSITCDPSGKFLYAGAATLFAGSPGGINAFTYDSVTGVLTPVAGSPFVSGIHKNFTDLKIVHGNYLYACNQADATVDVFTYNAATGVLTPIAGSPFKIAVPAGGKLTRMTIDPSGDFVYFGVIVSSSHNSLGQLPFEVLPYLYDRLTGIPYQLAFSVQYLSSGGTEISANGDIIKLTPGMCCTPDGKFLFIGDRIPAGQIITYRSVRGYPILNATLDPLGGSAGTLDIYGTLTMQGVPVATLSNVVGLLNDRGSYDASGNTYPATGGSGAAGAILKGDLWYISVAGTLNGILLNVGDTVRALMNTPGQTNGNWDILLVASGNAATATKLLNIITIDGVNFDGTANITIVAPATHAAGSKATPVAGDELPLADSGASFVLKKMTWGNLLGTILGTVNSWTKTQSVTPVALTVAANLVAVDLSLSNNFTLTLQATTGQTLSNPTNVVAGTSGQVAITQNAVPSTLAFGTNWIEATSGVAPAVSTTAGAQNLLSYYAFDATHLYYVLNKHGVA
jgi:6-phosphogluconolactonase